MRTVPMRLQAFWDPPIVQWQAGFCRSHTSWPGKEAFRNEISQIWTKMPESRDPLKSGTFFGFAIFYLIKCSTVNYCSVQRQSTFPLWESVGKYLDAKRSIHFVCPFGASKIQKNARNLRSSEIGHFLGLFHTISKCLTSKQNTAALLGKALWGLCLC
jgi:hypothetical protein